MNIIPQLKDIVGNDYVLLTKEDFIPYQKDASYFEGPEPLAIILPKSTEEISKIMKLCNNNDIPVVVRGGGSSLTGSSITTKNCVVLSMVRLDKIIDTNIGDRYIVAEAGVRLDVLNMYLSKFKHFYPPDPASSIAATVGGSIATNAGGLKGVSYGATKEWVLGLECVLADGEIINTGGKVLKRSLGYDLTALMIGNEGTLGIITKAILKIAPMPETIGRIVAYFDSIELAGNAIGSLKNQGVTPLMAEFMDRVSMDAISKTKNISFPKDANYLLLIDISSTNESINKKLNEALEIIKKSNPIEIKVTTDPKEMDVMYQARKGLFSSLLSEKKNIEDSVITMDIVVPASKLPETLKEIKNKIDTSGLKGLIAGHIGDGNVHPTVYANMKESTDKKKINDLMIEIGKIAVRHEGSISAEHGIGLEKKDLLLVEFEEKNTILNIEIMKKIKDIYDPKNILNRGKLLD
ncbi:MAG: FAD-binding oxidoreductase [Caldisphaera sp.]